ncbi:hypothetical protein [Mesomycoplasma ovipneumoniae]|uniref:hypothetical protein n=1 Tax=Mesomycoplasma ovipneumoniae TaxID=29562 RepID=UPI0030806616
MNFSEGAGFALNLKFGLLTAEIDFTTCCFWPSSKDCSSVSTLVFQSKNMWVFTLSEKDL